MTPPDRFASASARLHCRNRPKHRCVLTTQHPMGPALSFPEILQDWAAPGCNDLLVTYRWPMPSPAFPVWICNRDRGRLALYGPFLGRFDVLG